MAEYAEPARHADHDLRRQSQILIDALSRRGLCGATYDDANEVLRAHIASVIMLVHNPPTFLQFQDNRSIELLERLEKEAIAIDRTLEEIDSHSHEDTGVRLNLCEVALAEHDIEHVRSVVLSLRSARQRAQELGMRARRGEQPLPLYYEFVRRLHQLYTKATGRKGWSEMSGKRAEGDFVEFVFETQAMLAPSLRCNSLKAVGSRVVTAFPGTNPEK